jgi:hypothetical protein
VGTNNSWWKGWRGWHALAIASLLLLLIAPVSAQEAEFPAGAFAVTIAFDDVPPTLIDGASLIGRWQIAFAADGSWQRSRQDVGELTRGGYTVEGERLTLRDQAGVLACGGGEDEADLAIYGWRLTAEGLRLTAEQEPCAARRLLLTTRTLTPFVACPAVASAATPVGDDLTSKLEAVLTTMSACWATTQPDRFLPLLSRDLRQRFTTAADDPDRLALVMNTPLVWDGAQDLTVIAPDRVAATVRQTSGDTIDVLRGEFVWQDGGWRWDGASDPPPGTPVAG